MITEQNLENLKKDILRARQWAEAHFNVHQIEDHLLAPPTFAIDWLDVDRMRISACAYGRRLFPSFEYRLGWVDGKLAWISKHPLSGQRIVLYVGTEEEIEEIKNKFYLAREESRRLLDEMKSGTVQQDGT